MENQEVLNILAELNFPYTPTAIAQFCREEDGSPYDVWKIETEIETAVLKKTSPEERTTCEAFFPRGGCGTPKIYGFTEHGGDTYMLMEFFEGETMSHSTHEKLVLALDALIQMQEKFWENTELADVGWTFEKRHTAREKRLPYMEDLAAVYSAYLEADKTVPRTLCNDDLLPFNVLANKDRAVIIDWEFGGILPYPCALARLLAFGEVNTDFMFQMSGEDKEFAVQYYYDNLIKSKGIPWDEYIRTMKLFFLKEYSEWVYFARTSNDFTKPEYQKYYAKCKILAKDFGYYPEHSDNDGMKATHIFFVRHAEPNYSNHDDLTRELTEKGLRDRELVTSFLADKQVDIVLSSPYKRAVDTVGHFALTYGFPITTVQDFRERNVDSGWIDDFDAFTRRQWEDFDYKLNDGETLAEVQKRNVAALQKVIEQHRGKTVVIGSHGTALSAIVNYYQPQFGFEEFLRIKSSMPWVVHFAFSGNNCDLIEEFDLFSGNSRRWG